MFAYSNDAHWLKSECCKIGECERRPAPAEQHFCRLHLLRFYMCENRIRLCFRCFGAQDIENPSGRLHPSGSNNSGSLALLSVRRCFGNAPLVGTISERKIKLWPRGSERGHITRDTLDFAIESPTALYWNEVSWNQKCMESVGQHYHGVDEEVTAVEGPLANQKLLYFRSPSTHTAGCKKTRSLGMVLPPG